MEGLRRRRARCMGFVLTGYDLRSYTNLLYDHMPTEDGNRAPCPIIAYYCIFQHRLSCILNSLQYHTTLYLVLFSRTMFCNNLLSSNISYVLHCLIIAYNIPLLKLLYMSFDHIMSGNRVLFTSALTQNIDFSKDYHY